MSFLLSISLEQRGALSVSIGAAFWGLFWIPLRFLNESGIYGLWAVAAVTAAAALPAFLWTFYRRELADLRSHDSWMIGLALGSSAALYFLGVMLSDVIRVIMLFYLLPIWTTLAARVLYGEPIRIAQLLMIIVALLGMWLLLGGGARLPLPGNTGDWCGLGAGMLWGVSLALLRGKHVGGALPSVFIAMSVTATLALSTALLMSHAGQLLPGSSVTVALAISGDGKPSMAAWRHGLPVIVLFGWLVLFPAMFSQIYGAKLIPAPTAALLTMTEILVATVSAWMLIGTELTALSLLGGLIIFIAVLGDLGLQYQRNMEANDLH